MKKFNFKKIGMRVGGAAVGGAAAKAVNKVLPNLNPTMRSGGKILLGAILPELAPKSDLLGAVGMGMIGAATAEIVADKIPALAGTEDDLRVGGPWNDDVTGFEEGSDQPTFELSGTDDMRIGATDDEIMEG